MAPRTAAQRLTQLAAQAGDLRQLIERLIGRAPGARRAEAQKRAELEAQRRAAAQAADLPAPLPETPSSDGAVAAAAAAAISGAAADPSKPASPPPLRRARAAAMVYPGSGELDARASARTTSSAWPARASPSRRARRRRSSRRSTAGSLFAGPFRGYGQILIIEHGDGYHSLLAGLDRIDGAVGQWLVAGEPVGVMPERRGRSRAFISSCATTASRSTRCHGWRPAMKR